MMLCFVSRSGRVIPCQLYTSNAMILFNLGGDFQIITFILALYNDMLLSLRLCYSL
jgi:hypothetical protein